MESIEYTTVIFSLAIQRIQHNIIYTILSLLFKTIHPKHYYVT